MVPLDLRYQILILKCYDYRLVSYGKKSFNNTDGSENHRLENELFLSWQGGIKLITYSAALLLKGFPEPFFIITTSRAIQQKCNV